MPEIEEQPAVTLIRLTNGYQVTQAIHVAATLKLADLIANDPRSAEELGRLVEANSESLYRLLRALATVGIFRETHGHRFVATPMSELLRSDHPRSMRGWPLFVGRPYHREAWGDLLHCVRSGEDAYRHLHNMSTWEYRAGLPEEVSVFSLAMSSLSRTVVGAVLSAYDFGRFGKVVDVGGADGSFLTEILRANTGPRGVVFDLPHVVKDAESVIAAAGLESRCETAAGSYFDGVPGGGDAYVVKSVLHDCPDEDCARILRNVRKAMAPQARLVVVEQIVGDSDPAQTIAFGDLNMLVGTGGRERRLDEWQTVFADGGFELLGTTPTESPFFVIEGKAAAP